VTRREYHEELPSTQQRALVLARAGAPAGTVVVAGRQSAGLGRSDHIWWSPPGGLYLSMVVPFPPRRAALLPLALGARLSEAFAVRFRIEIRVKWPNDLIVLDSRGTPRKLGGVLVDAVPSPTLGTAAVIGVGLNVAPIGDAPSQVRARPVALSELVSEPPSLYEVEGLTVSEVGRVAEAIQDPVEAEELLTLCRARLYGVGRRASVDGRPVGTIEGLGEEGELWCMSTEGPVAVRAGDLTVEESP